MLAKLSTIALRYGMAGVVMISFLLPPSVAAAQGKSKKELADDVIAKAKADAAKKPDLAEQWSDFLHYINIARPKIAASYGQAILDAGTTPREIYMLSINKTDSLETLRKGAKLEGLGELVKKYRQAIEKGYLAWRSDPAQIEESIKMLHRSLEGYRLGISRLADSGEYAIPLLLQKLMDEKTPQVQRERIVTMLHKLGPVAVRGYSVALQAKDTQFVGFVANALKQIEYPAALPRLREALLRKDLPEETRKAITAAIISCNGGSDSALKKSPAELFYAQAVKYYNRNDSLRPDPRYDNAFVWFWKPATGAQQILVPKEILCDIYAMRMSRLALKHDTTFSPAVPLWLSACVRREVDLPEGKTDPLWPKERPKAAFYTLASSPRYLQQVLGRALKDGNVAIAKAVIRSMSKTTGPVSLIKPLDGGAQPLVSAMGYPDRNVRFLAGETLTLAMPTKDFAGSAMVMSLLNEALRQSGKKYALVIAANDKKRNTLKDAVRAAGYEVLSTPDIRQALTVAQQAIGLDAVIVGPDTLTLPVIRRFRGTTNFYYMPIVVTKPTAQMNSLAAKDGKIVILNPTKIGDEAAVAKALAKAMALSAGKALSEDEALAWAIRAANAIRTVGERDKSIYNLRRTVDSLSAAAGSKSAKLQIAASRALAVINSDKAQREIVALALKADADEAVRIAAFNAASESVRRYGNKCIDAQCKALVEMVAAPKAGELLKAAAQLLGTMNLTSEKMPKLIESTDKLD
ncbi:MAG: hypothetical protein K8S55_05565 [Phycisphaerae bacterium]|nr:hypothetical protein [Phycisphaerae bacterium]